jgi:hypothetical protein
MQDKSHVQDTIAWFNQEVFGLTATPTVSQHISLNPNRPHDNGLSMFRQGFEDDKSTDDESNSTQVEPQARPPTPAMVSEPAGIVPLQTISLLANQQVGLQDLQLGTVHRTIDTPVNGPGFRVGQDIPPSAVQTIVLTPQSLSAPSTGSISANGPDGVGDTLTGKKSKKCKGYICFPYPGIPRDKSCQW